MRFMLGVDEAGRGPLAGPVAVGIVAVTEGFDIVKEFPNVADSKQLSEKKREKLFSILEARTVLGDLRFRVFFGEPLIIDRDGIAVVIRHIITRGVRALASKTFSARIMLDGALRAPTEYSQETIIGGDETIPLISLASIAAKVLRDRRMVALAEQYPQYGFAQHKGYGTKAHYEALRVYGSCILHRQSFLHLDSSNE